MHTASTSYLLLDLVFRKRPLCPLVMINPFVLGIQLNNYSGCLNQTRRAGSVLLREQSRGSSKYSALPLRLSCVFFSPRSKAQRLEHNKNYNIYSVPVSEVSTLQCLIEFYYSDSISWYREDRSVTILPSFLRSLSWEICKLLCACKPTMPVLAGVGSNISPHCICRHAKRVMADRIGLKTVWIRAVSVPSGQSGVLWATRVKQFALHNTNFAIDNFLLFSSFLCSSFWIIGAGFICDINYK